MNRYKLMEHKVSFKDHGGGVVVHFAAGTVALFGAIVLGRRLLRLRDVHDSSVGVESPGSTIIGSDDNIVIRYFVLVTFW